MQRTSTMIDISEKKPKMKPKSIKSKFSKMVKKVFKKKTTSANSESVEQNVVAASVPVQRKNNDFDVEKWRKNLAKTCHDYDQMNATTYSLRSRNDQTFASVRSNGSVYREELSKMKSEIAELQRQKEQLQRGLMIRGASQRKSQRYRNQRNKRNTYRSQAIGYQSDSGEKLRRAPKKRLSGYYSGSSYDSNDSNCFYVFL